MDELFQNILDFNPKELDEHIKLAIEQDSPTQGEAIHKGWDAIANSVIPDEPADEVFMKDTVNKLKRLASGAQKKKNKAKKPKPNISLLLKKMEESCVKPNIKVPTTELEAYSIKALENLKHCTEAKRHILKGWYSKVHGGNNDQTFYKMITKGGLHKLRYLADDSMIPKIITNSQKIVKHADLSFWKEVDEIPTIEISKKKIISLEWLME